MNKRLFISLIIHMLVAGLVLTVFTLGPYMYKVNLYGNYLRKPDGTPLSSWEYLSLSNPQRSFLMFFVVPLVELNFWFVFRNRWKLNPILSSVFIGLLIAMLISFRLSQKDFIESAFASITPFLIFAGYAFTYGAVRNYIFDRERRKEIRLQQTENELKGLKAQLNPHFLFNSLNYLYGTALVEEAHRTARAAAVLSEMMRYTISGLRENFVPVAEEINFINNYLFLQRERIPLIDNIRIDTSIESDKCIQKIAPLLLLPFIENAFQYGISMDYPCFIDLKIVVAGDNLVMKISNQIIPEQSVVRGNNTGIQNTKRRLELLYSNNFTLDVCVTDILFSVSLSVKLSASQN